MTKRYPLFFLLAALSLAGGCATEKRTYQIVLQNRLDQPVTLWPTKDGPPDEEAWRSPEQIASMTHEQDDSHAPIPPVAPGQTATSPIMEGQFDHRSQAWLRIYIGTPTLADMLAISRGSTNRLDVPLEPGMNRIILDDQTGSPVVKRVVRPSDANALAAPTSQP